MQSGFENSTLVKLLSQTKQSTVKQQEKHAQSLSKSLVRVVSSDFAGPRCGMQMTLNVKGNQHQRQAKLLSLQ